MTQVHDLFKRGFDYRYVERIRKAKLFVESYESFANFRRVSCPRSLGKTQMGLIACKRKEKGKGEVTINTSGIYSK